MSPMTNSATPSRGSCGVTITSIRTAASAAPQPGTYDEGRMIKETPPHGGRRPRDAISRVVTAIYRMCAIGVKSIHPKREGRL